MYLFMSSHTILGLTGMPGSGKTEMANILKGYGFLRVTMGDVIRKEVKGRGMERTAENCRLVMYELREQYGTDIIAKKTVEHIETLTENKIVIDGIRSMVEYDYFKSVFNKNFIFVAIHVNLKIRFLRLQGRTREDDPSSYEDFIARDEGELRLGLGEVISLSPYIIQNNDSLNCLKEKIGEFIKDIVG